MKRLFFALATLAAMPAVGMAHPGHSPTDGQHGVEHYVTQADHFATLASGVVVVAVVLAAICFAARYFAGPIRAE